MENSNLCLYAGQVKDAAAVIHCLRRTEPVHPKTPRLLSRLVVGRFAGNRCKGKIIAGAFCVPVALGAGGLSYSKREGDRRTPCGRFRVKAILQRLDRMPRLVSLPGVADVTKLLGWCDDPGATLYNRPVKLPFKRSHENLFRDDKLYDVIVVLDYNFEPRKRNLGSAIFFHISEESLSPTQGCIAIRVADMRRLVPKLSKDVAIIIPACANSLKIDVRKSPFRPGHGSHPAGSQARNPRSSPWKDRKSRSASRFARATRNAGILVRFPAGCT
jgi:L,D-peptidoglycan transpeptidase YkuD (ErfK/YbiS/YcfS/YnhG family)